MTLGIKTPFTVVRFSSGGAGTSVIDDYSRHRTAIGHSCKSRKSPKPDE